ncbi:hypothetical protein ACGFIW_19540 [Micromonospora sp. NPDC048935]|uniref:NACHT N-terminal helical domain 7-containing protein n=1 Tax=Micromonospora sp. NPDC048935 TaxID=3364262 RepID=UPI0037139A90
MDHHLTGLAVWDQADEHARRILAELLERRLPAAPVARYDEIHRRLDEEIPEFALWAESLEARATSRAWNASKGCCCGSARAATRAFTAPSCPLRRCCSVSGALGSPR